MADRLSPEDSRILALESKSVVGHTCKVIIAERTGDGVRYLRDRIVRRLSLAPGCRRRIVDVPHELDGKLLARCRTALGKNLDDTSRRYVRSRARQRIRELGAKAAERGLHGGAPVNVSGGSRS